MPYNDGVEVDLGRPRLRLAFLRGSFDLVLPSPAQSACSCRFLTNLKQLAAAAVPSPGEGVWIQGVLWLGRTWHVTVPHRRPVPGVRAAPMACYAMVHRKRTLEGSKAETGSRFQRNAPVSWPVGLAISPTHPLIHCHTTHSSHSHSSHSAQQTGFSGQESRLTTTDYLLKVRFGAFL